MQHPGPAYSAPLLGRDCPRWPANRLGYSRLSGLPTRPKRNSDNYRHLAHPKPRNAERANPANGIRQSTSAFVGTPDSRQTLRHVRYVLPEAVIARTSCADHASHSYAHTAGPRVTPIGTSSRAARIAVLRSPYLAACP